MCGDYLPDYKTFPTLEERVDKIEKSHEEILGLLTKMVDFLHNVNEVEQPSKRVPDEKNHAPQCDPCID